MCVRSPGWNFVWRAQTNRRRPAELNKHGGRRWLRRCFRAEFERVKAARASFFPFSPFPPSSRIVRKGRWYRCSTILFADRETWPIEPLVSAVSGIIYNRNYRICLLWFLRENQEKRIFFLLLFEFSMPSNLFNALFCIGIIGIKEIRLIWKFVARKEWIGIFSRIERLFEGARWIIEVSVCQVLNIIFFLQPGG